MAGHISSLGEELRHLPHTPSSSGVEAPSWPLDVLAVQYAPMNQLRGPNSFGEEKAMKSILSAAATVVTIVATVACATSLAERSKREIVGLTADEVR